MASGAAHAVSPISAMRVAPRLDMLLPPNGVGVVHAHRAPLGTASERAPPPHRIAPPPSRVRGSMRFLSPPQPNFFASSPFLLPDGVAPPRRTNFFYFNGALGLTPQFVNYSFGLRQQLHSVARGAPTPVSPSSIEARRPNVCPFHGRFVQGASQRALLSLMRRRRTTFSSSRPPPSAECCLAGAGVAGWRTRSCMDASPSCYRMGSMRRGRRCACPLRHPLFHCQSRSQQGGRHYDLHQRQHQRHPQRQRSSP